VFGAWVACGGDVSLYAVSHTGSAREQGALSATISLCVKGIYMNEGNTISLSAKGNRMVYPLNYASFIL
jgi:hypothetical protein